MEKFNADWDKRLPKEIGRDVINNGKRLGDGCHVKDSYWAGYEKDGRYYISLNDEEDTVWETSYEDMEMHCLEY